MAHVRMAHGAMKVKFYCFSLLLNSYFFSLQVTLKWPLSKVSTKSNQHLKPYNLKSIFMETKGQTLKKNLDIMSHYLSHQLKLNL